MSSVRDKKRRTVPFTGRPLAALAVSILLNALAFIAVKTMVVTVGGEAGTFSLPVLMEVVSSPYLWTGGVSFLASMYFWVLALKTLDLSLAYPTASLSYVLVAVVSYYAFDEALTPFRAAGMILIMGGIFIMYRRPKPNRYGS